MAKVLASAALVACTRSIHSALGHLIENTLEGGVLDVNASFVAVCFEVRVV